MRCIQGKVIRDVHWLQNNKMKIKFSAMLASWLWARLKLLVVWSTSVVQQQTLWWKKGGKLVVQCGKSRWKNVKKKCWVLDNRKILNTQGEKTRHSEHKNIMMRKEILKKPLLNWLKTCFNLRGLHQGSQTKPWWRPRSRLGHVICEIWQMPDGPFHLMGWTTIAIWKKCTYANCHCLSI